MASRLQNCQPSFEVLQLDSLLGSWQTIGVEAATAMTKFYLGARSESSEIISKQCPIRESMHLPFLQMK